MSPRSATTPRSEDLEARRRQITDEIASLGPTLPGSLVMRTSRCGNAGCRCRAEPPQRHGPYPAWTRSVNGKTITRSLSPATADRLQPWIDNARRLQQLVDELKTLAVEQAHADHQPPAT